MNEILFGRHRLWPPHGLVKRLIWTAAGSFALGGLYAWRLENHWLRIERRDMSLPGLGGDLDGATLAHISDLHCSPIVLDKYLRQCVDAINDLDVDFVAITGDFITGPRHYARRVGRVLSQLRPRCATVACLGNHDYGLLHPRGLGQTRDLAEYVAEQLSRADIFIMLNESRVFRKGDSAVQFVGLEDYWSGRFNPSLAFELTHGHLPTIALCHNPDAAGEVASWGPDWILAGHTHGTGTAETRLSDLVFPTNCKHFAAGEYPLADGTRLYVNRGLGYAKRRNLNARPEITLFTLRDRQTVPQQGSMV